MEPIDQFRIFFGKVDGLPRTKLAALAAKPFDNRPVMDVSLMARIVAT